jgi:dihydroorotate dehydrogenase
VYKQVIRPFLFRFEPEKIHHFSVTLLRVIFSIPGIKLLFKSFFTINNKSLERDVFGLKFKNPIGLAAGFDKDATMLDQLDTFGFGFIEIGTLTPKPQTGNPKPRLFRLPDDRALINRMGFNNEGVLHAVERLRERKTKVIIGGNIGKNKDTENKYAYRDYEYCIEALYDVVDYFVVNISSPNTPNLRDLQDKEPLKTLLSRLHERNKEKKQQRPMLLKIAPDLTDGQLNDIVEIVRGSGLDGIIATNTTISREGLATPADQVESIGHGGLSGAPITERSNQMIARLRQLLGPEFPIIGVGGIMTPQDAIDKLKSGASLVQVYTGFIYNGPAFVKQINKLILKSGL